MVKKTSIEITQRIIGYVTAAFSLVGALAWNDAVKALIESFFVVDKNTITAKFIYAIIISIIVVLISIYLTRITETKKE